MLYLAVQADQYELPIAVAESVSSLARMLKVSEMSIMQQYQSTILEEIQE